MTNLFFAIRRSFYAALLLPVFAHANSVNTNADLLFNWAEANFPSILNDSLTSQVLFDYYYRGPYVQPSSDSQFYLGVTLTANPHVVMFDTGNDTGLIDLGLMSDWLSTANITVDTLPEVQQISLTLENANDDVEERLSDGYMYFDSSDLELGTDPDTLGDQIVGIRFNKVNIPSDASISSAYLEFTTDKTSHDRTLVTFYGEASGNATTFTQQQNLSQRPNTTASISWDIPVWDTENAKHRTPNLATVLQEIIGHQDWASGNSLVLFIKGEGTRIAKSYDDDATSAPVLHIEFTTGTPSVEPTDPEEPIEPTDPVSYPNQSAGCGLSATTGHRYESILSSGSQRKYYLSVPEDYDPNKSYNLVFGYHGNNYDGKRMRNYLRLEDTPQAKDILFVYPNGLNRYWKEFRSSAIGWFLNPYDNQDFVLFDDILTDIETHFCIDTKRVYVTGQSWGGDMTSALACGRGSKIAAAVAVGVNGDFFFTGRPDIPELYPELDYSDCQRTIPMITYRGEDDTYKGGKASDWWYGVNQCQQPAGNTTKEDINKNGYYEDQNCLVPNIFVRYSNGGGSNDHQIPDKFEYETMDFFQQHTLP